MASEPLLEPPPPRARPLSGRVAELRRAASTPLLRNGYFLMISSVAMSALGFPFWVLAARNYSATTVGESTTIVSAMTLVSGLGQLGMAGVLIRYIPGAGRRSWRLVGLSYAGTLLLTLALAAAAAATAGLWSPPVSFVAHDWGWFALFVAANLIWTIFSIQDSVLAGLRQTHWVPIENIVFALAKLALVVALAVALPHSGIVIAWILPGLILIAPVNGAIFGRFLPRHVRDTSDSVAQWHFNDIRRFVVGNTVGATLSLSGVFVLPIVVAGRAGAAHAAYFFMPWTLIYGLALLAASMATSLVVEAAFSESEIVAHARSTLRNLLRVIVPISVGILILAHPLLSVFGPEYAREGTGLLRILAVGAVPNAVVAVGLSIARLRHDGRLVAVAQSTVAILTVGISAALLPSEGIVVAGIAYTVAQLVALVLLRNTLRPLWARS
jgi:O-antigen/teichoic acid export membrane protein